MCVMQLYDRCSEELGGAIYSIETVRYPESGRAKVGQPDLP